MFTLLGPSGCGKTTTLRCIAGLEMPDAGEIAVADRTLFSSSRSVRVPANERGLGMVFQSYAIWPHMNVQKNVAFPLEVLPRKKRPSRSDIRERVERALAVVKLDREDQLNMAASAVSLLAVVVFAVTTALPALMWLCAPLSPSAANKAPPIAAFGGFAAVLIL